MTDSKQTEREYEMCLIKGIAYVEAEFARDLLIEIDNMSNNIDVLVNALKEIEINKDSGWQSKLAKRALLIMK